VDEEGVIFSHQWTAGLGIRPPLTQIGIRHANLLCKNSDKKFSPKTYYSIIGRLNFFLNRHKVSEFLTSASGWDTKPRLEHNGKNYFENML